MRFDSAGDCERVGTVLDHSFNDATLHSAAASSSAGRGGYHKGKNTSNRMLELAFRNFLTHSVEASFPPTNFLRSTGRARQLPKRMPPVPQLHVLADTCPAELKEVLATKPPAGVNVVFYKRLGNNRPSRDHQFLRCHFPNTHLTLDGSKRRATVARKDLSSRPATAPCPLAASNGASKATSAYVSLQLSSFERKNGLLAPLDAADGAARLQGSRGTQKQAEDSTLAAKLLFIAHSSKKLGLARLINAVSLVEAKGFVTTAHVTKDDFYRIVRRRLGATADTIKSELLELFHLLSGTTFQQQAYVEGTVQREVWVLATHYLWRRHYGDKQALFKLMHALFELRAASAQSEHAAVVLRAELQIAMSAYGAKKHALHDVLREVSQHLVEALPWQGHQVHHTDYLEAINARPLLREVFVGHSDKTFSYLSDG